MTKICDEWFVVYLLCEMHSFLIPSFYPSTVDFKLYCRLSIFFRNAINEYADFIICLISN